MKKIYNISLYILLLNIYIYFKDISCNQIINEKDSELGHVLETGNSDRNYDNKKYYESTNFNKNNLEESIYEVTQDEYNIHPKSNIVLDNKENNSQDHIIMNVNKDENKQMSFSPSLNEEANKIIDYQKNICEYNESFSYCPEKSFNEGDDWNSREVKNSFTDNFGVYTPPRRNKLCLLNIGHLRSSINDLTKLKEEIIKIASGESYSIMKYFKNDNINSFTAIRYSFSDIGDLVKGTDMIDNQNTKDINSRLLNIFSKQNGDQDIIKKRLEWWNNNKNDIWEAMICAYSGKKNVENFPQHNNIDEVPQFLRWFGEWGKYVCYEYEYILNILIQLCNIRKNKIENISSVEEMQKNDQCKYVLHQYVEWINIRKQQWFDQSKKFEKDKNNYDNVKGLKPEDYLNERCSECKCIKNSLNNIFSVNKFDNQFVFNMIKEIKANERYNSFNKKVIDPTDDLGNKDNEQLKEESKMVEGSAEGEYVDNTLGLDDNIKKSDDDIVDPSIMVNHETYENNNIGLGMYGKKDDEEKHQEIENESTFKDETSTYVSEHLDDQNEVSNEFSFKSGSRKKKRLSNKKINENEASKKKLSWFPSFGIPGISFPSFSLDPISIASFMSRIPGSTITTINTVSDAANSVQETVSSVQNGLSSLTYDVGSEEEKDEKSESENEHRSNESTRHSNSEDAVAKQSTPLPLQQNSPQPSQQELPHDPYERVLGWEFGNVHVPGTNPYISSKESDSLELINLTSWDKEDIIKQNEDVQEEKEEEQADEELKKEEIEEEQDLLQDEEEYDEFEEEDDQDELKDEEEQDEEEDKSTKGGEQEKKTEDEKKEETIDSSDDKNPHESLSIGLNNNMETKKDAESIVKDLFSLFKDKNNFESLLKDLTGDITRLFQINK
ncbi:duffy binding-like merozoite surface protein [Plasmodium gaboni]|uniref:Duffy binding-like merozoite surface protein n=1 Tax=Plasmodium gaboni TaxID=647221 RepID=A0A151L3E4_9APIC|nr:duffy binding-like merozoite surface protein [Plasmodium gaboni]KYN93473.1 duffy binding-like merozoite surface protein [Plasmodium gaboni]